MMALYDLKSSDAYFFFAFFFFLATFFSCFLLSYFLFCHLFLCFLLCHFKLSLQLKKVLIDWLNSIKSFLQSIVALTIYFSTKKWKVLIFFFVFIIPSISNDAVINRVEIFPAKLLREH